MGKRRTGRIRNKKLWDEDLSKIQLRKSGKRAVILTTVFFFVFAIISFRLVDLMVLNHKTLSGKASRQYLRVKTLKPQRGVIWDRRMREMAINIDSDSLYAVPSEIEDIKHLSSRLAPVIKVSASRLNKRLLKRKDKDFIWLSRKMDDETHLKVMALKEEVGSKAIDFLTESKRYYPRGRTAAHILGYTDIDNRGIEGIELRCDEHLKGEGKEVLMNRDARGNSFSGNTDGATSGKNVLLTIDESVQYIVERELSKAVKEWEAKAGVAIMMDPVTGEILAMANAPTYNPNSPGKSPDYMRRNRAITDLYEPGSTFKTFLAAAALQEGEVRLNDEFDVSKGYIVVGGKAVRDVHRNEIITFQDVIQKSSNVGAVQIGLKLGKEEYYRYIKKFGFGERTGIDLPGEVKGILRKPEDWSGTSLAALSIGQEIGVTPLQILSAYSAIANGGIMMKPYIVSEIISPTGEVIKSFSPEIIRSVVSEDTSAITRDVLKSVVEEGGTAQKAYVNGNLVAGKTGTAQMIDPETGRYSRDRYVSSFVGFVPADDPILGLIVVIYEPKGAIYGGTVAAPVFRNIVEHTLTYLDIPMEMDDNVLLVSK
jgi:cell division protein FtsI (penicillin-binding protein 3)